VLARNMVFFLHMILMDSDTGHPFCLGRAYIIGTKRPEPLSAYPLTMIVR
jgi:Xaa-Pro dipeptidase